MATNLKVQDHHVISFTRNVELLLQQSQPQLAGTTSAASYTGERAQVIKQFGEVEFKPFTSGTTAGQWRGETVWSDIEHHQRWVHPTDLVLSLPAARGDDLRMLTDPRSSYAEAMRAAYARRYDDFIIQAATADAKTGRYDDLQTTAFPAAQIIADGGTGLTVAKLRQARQMLLESHNNSNEEMYVACSQHQIMTDLLGEQATTNADYNTVRTLVNGEMNSFVGFKFMPTERLLSTVVTGPPAKTVRHCFAWVKSGLHVGTWNNLETHIDRRSDMNYVWQIWMSFTMGATRTQEKKIVQINCSE